MQTRGVRRGLGDTTILAQLPTSDAMTHPAGGQVALTSRPDPVLVAAAETSAKPLP